MKNINDFIWLFEDFNEAIYIVDKNRKMVYFNPAASKMSGYKRGETEGFFCFDNILNHVNEEGFNLCKNNCPLSKAMAEDRQEEHDVYLHHKLGHRIKVHVKVIPFKVDNEVIGAIEVFYDLTEQTLLLYDLDGNESLSLLDPLTNLYNRRVFGPILEKHLNAHLMGDLGILFIDFDDFKSINDQKGHDYGDKVLISMSQTVLRNVRKNDIVIRYGGDEIVVILLDVDRETMIRIGEKLRVLIENSKPKDFDLKKKYSASVGAVIKEQNETIEQAIIRADMIMYEAKHNGKQQTILK